MDENSFSIEKEKVHLLFYFHTIIEKVVPALKENEMRIELDCADDLYSVNFGDLGTGYAFISADGRQARFLWQCH